MLLLAGLAFHILWLDERPADTTDPRIFEADARVVDYCDLEALDGSKGRSADSIPKAYTPHCGWRQWPAPIVNRR